MIQIGMKRTLTCTYDEALIRVPEALKEEGFGILTSVDMKATLKTKLGVDFRRYTILGACNPTLGHEALLSDLGFGTMIPCNVALYETDDGKTVVQTVDPMQSIAPQVSPRVAEIAALVRTKLARAIEHIR